MLQLTEPYTLGYLFVNHTFLKSQNHSLQAEHIIDHTAGKLISVEVEFVPHIVAIHDQTDARTGLAYVQTENDVGHELAHQRPVVATDASGRVQKNDEVEDIVVAGYRKGISTTINNSSWLQRF